MSVKENVQVCLDRGTKPLTYAELWNLSETLDHNFGATCFAAGLRNLLLDNQKLRKALDDSGGLSEGQVRELAEHHDQV